MCVLKYILTNVRHGTSHMCPNCSWPIPEWEEHRYIKYETYVLAQTVCFHVQELSIHTNVTIWVRNRYIYYQFKRRSDLTTKCSWLHEGALYDKYFIDLHIYIYIQCSIRVKWKNSSTIWNRPIRSLYSFPHVSHCMPLRYECLIQKLTFDAMNKTSMLLIAPSKYNASYVGYWYE